MNNVLVTLGDFFLIGPTKMNTTIDVGFKTEITLRSFGARTTNRMAVSMSGCGASFKPASRSSAVLDETSIKDGASLRDN